MIINGKKYLVTSDSWFFAPDGYLYRAVWGKCELIEAKDTFGFVPLRPSTNWFLKCGNVILAGCQIHFAVRCEDKPNIRQGFIEKDGESMQINSIYIAR